MQGSPSYRRTDVIQKYFGKSLSQLDINESVNDLTINGFTFEICGDGLVFKNGPSDFMNFTKSLYSDIRSNVSTITWEAVGWIKIHAMGSNTVVEMARTGKLYDEDYYKARGGGSPYIGYPKSYLSVNLEAQFERLTTEFCEKYGTGHKLLELGCATGILVGTLQQSGVDAFGVDISDYAIANGVCPSLYRMDALNLGSPSDYFDFIISTDFLEHIGTSKLAALFAEQVRVSKNGAHLLHFVPFYDADVPFECDAHLTCASRRWWSDFLRRLGGLKIVQTPEEGNTEQPRGNPSPLLESVWICEVLKGQH